MSAGFSCSGVVTVSLCGSAAAHWWCKIHFRFESTRLERRKVSVSKLFAEINCENVEQMIFAPIIACKGGLVAAWWSEWICRVEAELPPRVFISAKSLAPSPLQSAVIHCPHISFNFKKCMSVFIFDWFRKIWNSFLHSTRWGGLWDPQHEQHLLAHHLWAGSFPFPPRALCSFRGRPARLAMLEAKQPIPWYQDRVGYTPLTSWSRCRWAWWCRLLAIICLHCLPKLASFGKTGTNFSKGN